MEKTFSAMPQSTRKTKCAMKDSTNTSHLVDAEGKEEFYENDIKLEPYNTSIGNEEMEHEFIIQSAVGHSEYDPLAVGGKTDEPVGIPGFEMRPCGSSDSQCIDDTVLPIKRLRTYAEPPEADTLSLPTSCRDEVISCSSDDEVILCSSDDEVILCSSDDEGQTIWPYTPSDKAPVVKMLNTPVVKVEPDPLAVASAEPSTPDDTAVPYFWVGEELANRVVPFAGKPAIRYKHSGAPEDFFKLVLNYEFRSIFVKQANECGAEMAKGFKGTRLKNSIQNIVSLWKPIGMDEFEIWLGILIQMGGIQCPSFTHYWSSDVFHQSSFFTQVSSLMSRDRWIGIMQTLHFQKAEPSKPPKPVFKIEPLIKSFNERMKSLYSPERELFLEEPMVMVQSKLIPWSSLRDKKRGIKLHSLTNPDGLILRFLADKADVSHEPTSCRVVKSLLEDFFNKGHSVFMDSCYNSVDLCHELLSDDLHTSGPLSQLRKNVPDEILESKLEPGHIIYMKSNHGVVLLRWRDENEQVLFISSEFSPFTVETSYKSDKVLKPEAVAVFDKQVSAFGKPLHRLTEFGAVQKHTNNHVKISVHIIQMAVYNAYLLYRKTEPAIPLDFAEFRREVVRKLCNMKKTVSSAPVTKVTPDAGAWHVLEPTEVLETPAGKKKRVFVKCEQCRKGKTNKVVTSLCSQCPSSPGLCVGNCFVRWHLELGFSNVSLRKEGTEKPL